MPRKKRSRTSDDVPSRQAVTTAPTAAIAPTAATALAAATVDTSSAIFTNEPDSSQKSLSGAELSQQVLRMVKNRNRAELMILELMEEYSFSMPRLKELLRGTLSLSCD